MNEDKWNKVPPRQVVFKEEKKVVELPKYPEGILEFINFGNIVRIGLDQPYQSWCKENLKSNNSIHKVKNSKGEVFTVGDETTNGEIKIFDTERNCNYIVAECWYSKRYVDSIRRLYVKIDDLQNPKQPILKSEDGFCLFDCDKMCYLTPALEYRETIIKSNEPLCSDFKYFKHKANAEKYIEENKKQFSVKDIDNARKRIQKSPIDGELFLKFLFP